MYILLLLVITDEKWHDCENCKFCWRLLVIGEMLMSAKKRGLYTLYALFQIHKNWQNYLFNMESTQASIIAAKQSQSTPDLHKLTVLYKYKSLHYAFMLFNFFTLPMWDPQQRWYGYWGQRGALEYINWYSCTYLRKFYMLHQRNCAYPITSYWCCFIFAVYLAKRLLLYATFNVCHLSM